jgi:predicted butyrate kinase (DUF1464 family)
MVVGDYFTAAVVVENDKIVDAAPILRRFVGQSLAKLDAWQHVEYVHELTDEDLPSGS